ncbi:hypothetical protein R6Q57_022835 [Mikania cordata]
MPRGSAGKAFFSIIQLLRRHDQLKLFAPVNSTFGLGCCSSGAEDKIHGKMGEGESNAANVHPLDKDCFHVKVELNACYELDKYICRNAAPLSPSLPSKPHPRNNHIYTPAAIAVAIARYKAMREGPAIRVLRYKSVKIAELESELDDDVVSKVGSIRLKVIGSKSSLAKSFE